MPQNKNLKPVNLPMDLKFGEEPMTKFENNLSALKVELVDSPTRSQAPIDPVNFAHLLRHVSKKQQPVENSGFLNVVPLIAFVLFYL